MSRRLVLNPRWITESKDSSRQTQHNCKVCPVLHAWVLNLTGKYLYLLASCKCKTNILSDMNISVPAIFKQTKKKKPQTSHTNNASRCSCTCACVTTLFSLRLCVCGGAAPGETGGGLVWQMHRMQKPCRACAQDHTSHFTPPTLCKCSKLS